MKLVDLIPNISTTGDYRKISDSDTFNNNNKVATLFNVLEYADGKNSLFPEMGVYKILNEIPCTENMDEVMGKLSTALTKFLSFPVAVNYRYSDETMENVIIDFTISGLPGSIKVTAKKANGNVKLVNPKYIK